MEDNTPTYKPGKGGRKSLRTLWADLNNSFTQAELATMARVLAVLALIPLALCIVRLWKIFASW